MPTFTHFVLINPNYNIKVYLSTPVSRQTPGKSRFLPSRKTKKVSLSLSTCSVNTLPSVRRWLLKCCQLTHQVQCFDNKPTIVQVRLICMDTPMWATGGWVYFFLHVKGRETCFQDYCDQSPKPCNWNKIVGFGGGGYITKIRETATARCSNTVSGT